VPLLLLGSPFFLIILFLSTTLLTGMTGLTMHIQWPLTSHPNSLFVEINYMYNFCRGKGCPKIGATFRIVKKNWPKLPNWRKFAQSDHPGRCAPSGMFIQIDKVQKMKDPLSSFECMQTFLKKVGQGNEPRIFSCSFMFLITLPLSHSGSPPLHSYTCMRSKV
jgi:hypothetical protein